MEGPITIKEKQEAFLRQALTLIKRHITKDQTPHNRDLHIAVGLIVDAARLEGMLTR